MRSKNARRALAWLRSGFALASAWIALLVVGTWREPLPKYTRGPVARPPDFDTFYAEKLAASAREGVRESNRERAIRVAQRTDLALLYLHGFGAARAEGEYVVERLANDLNANAYFARLPGHGSRMAELERHDFAEYLRQSEQALEMLANLGDKRVVIGTSLGGLLATYLAATHPEQVSGLVLFSPFYDFVGIGKLLDVWGGLTLARAFVGPVRNTEQDPQLRARIHSEYAQHWYTREYTSSLRVVRDLKRFASRPELFARVRCPVLLLYYPADDVADVAAMRAAFERFQPHVFSRRVPVDYGNHILASAYVDTDKALVVRASERFLEQLR